MKISVGVAPRTTLSVATVAELQEQGKLPKRDLKTALEEEWDFSAHAVPYRITAPDGSAEFIRLKKDSELFHGLRDNDYRIEIQSVFLDYDLPKHRAWKNRAEAEEWVDGVLADLAPEARPYCTYTTAHGARLVYRLKTAVDVLEYEQLATGIILEFGQAGIEIDSTCAQWHRLYRLPFAGSDDPDPAPRAFEPVIRYEETYLDPDMIDEVDPDLIPKLKPTRDAIGKVDYDYRPMPAPDELDALLVEEYTNAKGQDRQRRTEWAKKAYAHLRYGTPLLLQVLKGERDLPTEGGRDMWLTRTAGTLVKRLHDIEGASPEGVLALIYETLDGLEPDDDTPNWHAKAWDLIQRFWAQDEARLPVMVEHGGALPEELEDRRERLVAIMKESHPHVPELQAEFDTAWAWVEKHLILVLNSRHFYILNWDGLWSARPLTRMGLHSEIKALGMDTEIPAWKLTEEGLKPKKIDEFIGDYGTEIFDVEYSCYAKQGVLLGRKLRSPAHAVNKALKPKFDKEVHTWLSICGGAFAETLIDWVACAIHVEGPIPLLSIRGSAGVGKNLLVRGLAECFDVHTYSEGGSLMGWNGALIQNPILHLDEGIATLGPTSSAKAFSEQIRKMIGGSSVLIKEKFQPEVQVEINPRVILTANNMDLLGAVVGKFQSLEDLEALQNRIVHLEFSHAAAIYLEENGGRRFTGDWIGSASSHRLAAHLLYLYERKLNDISTREGRFLLPGHIPLDAMVQMTFDDTRAMDVFEMILDFVDLSEEQHTNDLTQHRIIDEGTGEIYLSESGVRAYEKRINMFGGPKNISIKLVRSILEYLGDRLPKARLSVKGVAGTAYRSWIQLDLDRLYMAYRSYKGQVPAVVLKCYVAKYGDEAARRMQELDAGSRPAATLEDEARRELGW